VGSLEAVGRHDVDLISQLQVKEMYGPLEDLKGTIVEQSQWQLGAIPAYEDETGQEELFSQCGQCWRRIVALSEWRAAGHDGLEVHQEGRQRRFGSAYDSTNWLGSTSCEPKTAFLSSEIADEI
jgi:hypothetical protein